LFHVVSYDIENDKARTTVAKILLDYGKRAQYSVFECILDDELLEKMVARVSPHILESDSFRVYRLCAGCEKAIITLGKGEPAKDKDVYIL